jgi:NADP-dependent 3-hydroxy acid dehydrogenase YdfG
VGDEASARAFIESAHSDLGRVDILVNNAGLMLLGPIEGADTEDWRRMVNVNLLGLLYCTHAALPLMREQGGGDIVNVSSVAGRFAGPGSGVYNLTKFGVNAFSEALRQEAVAAKIRVIVVEPGYVETELQGHNENPMVQEAMAKSKEKIGEVLRAEDIADGIAYAVTRPSHVAINEVLIRPAGQAR